MTKRRVLLVHGLLALLIGGSLFALLSQREYWPFSPYSMYSETQRERRLTRLWVFGVRQDVPGAELSLHEHRYIRPFYKSRLIPALGRLERDPRRRILLHRALEDVLDRYEERRARGRLRGPPLVGIRLYRLEWELDPRARNVNRPTRRTLVAEVTR